MIWLTFCKSVLPDYFAIIHVTGNITAIHDFCPFPNAYPDINSYPHSDERIAADRDFTRQNSAGSDVNSFAQYTVVLLDAFAERAKAGRQVDGRGCFSDPSLLVGDDSRHWAI